MNGTQGYLFFFAATGCFADLAAGAFLLTAPFCRAGGAGLGFFDGPAAFLEAPLGVFLVAPLAAALPDAGLIGTGLSGVGLSGAAAGRGGNFCGCAAKRACWAAGSE